MHTASTERRLSSHRHIHYSNLLCRLPLLGKIAPSTSFWYWLSIENLSTHCESRLAKALQDREIFIAVRIPGGHNLVPSGTIVSLWKFSILRSYNFTFSKDAIHNLAILLIQGCSFRAISRDFRNVGNIGKVYNDAKLITGQQQTYRNMKWLVF